MRKMRGQKSSCIGLTQHRSEVLPKTSMPGSVEAFVSLGETSLGDFIQEIKIKVNN